MANIFLTLLKISNKEFCHDCLRIAKVIAWFFILNRGLEDGDEECFELRKDEAYLKLYLWRNYFNKNSDSFQIQTFNLKLNVCCQNSWQKLFQQCLMSLTCGSLRGIFEVGEVVWQLGLSCHCTMGKLQWEVGHRNFSLLREK